MTAGDLRSISPFDSLAVEEAGGPLTRPDAGPYLPKPYEAGSPREVRDLLGDRSLVPAGGVRDAAGRVRAVFWQVRPGRQR